MQEELQKELAILQEPFCILVVVSTKNRDEVITSLLRLLGGREGKTPLCCYVAASKPAATLQGLFTLNGIPPQQIAYIDCIAAEMKSIHDSPIIHYVSSPRDLTGIGIQLNKLLIHKPRFAIIDSLNALLLHSSHHDVLRFLHFFSSFANSSAMSSIIFALAEDSDEKLLADIAQFCDSRIDLFK